MSEKQATVNDKQPTAMDKQPTVNSFGVFALCIAAAALIITLLCIFAVQMLEANKNPARHYGPDDMTVLTDKLDNGLSFFAQIIVFVVGGLVGGTMSFVGFIAGLCALAHPKRTTAQAAILTSLLPPMVLYYYLWSIGVF